MEIKDSNKIELEELISFREETIKRLAKIKVDVIYFSRICAMKNKSKPDEENLVSVTKDEKRYQSAINIMEERIKELSK